MSIDEKELAKERSDLRIGLLTGIILLIVAIVIIGIGPVNVSLFADTSGFMIIAIIVFGFMCMEQGLSGSFLVMQSLIFGHASTEKERRSVIAACGTATWTSLLGGMCTALIVAIKILARGINDLNTLRYGASIALLTVFYAIISAMFFIAMRSKYEQQAK